MRGTWGSALGWKPLAAKISWRVGTNVMQTGFHLRGALIEQADPEAAATEVADFVTNHFVTLLGGNDQVVGIDVVNMITKEGHSISPANLMGSLSNAGNEAPEFLCNTLQLKGELRTRYGQGRMFLPIRTEAWTNGGILTVAGSTALQAIATEMADRWTGNDLTGFNLINVHGLLPALPATPSRPAREQIEPSWYDVTSIRLNTATTFLRSRKAGVGS